MATAPPRPPPRHTAALLVLLDPTASHANIRANHAAIDAAVELVQRRLYVCFSATTGNDNDDGAGAGGAGAGTDGGASAADAAADALHSHVLTAYNSLWDASCRTGNPTLDSRVGLAAVDVRAAACFTAPGSASRAAAGDPDLGAVFTCGPAPEGLRAAVRGLDDARAAMGASPVAVVDLAASPGSGVGALLAGGYVAFDDPATDRRALRFRHVVLGGTFDHMHAGHKKLLSLACAICTGSLTVGVTSAKLLARKSLPQHIEGVDARRRAVAAFVKFANPRLELKLATIDDPFGPSITDPALEAVCASTETLRGCRLINEKRAVAGLKPLVIVTITRTDASTLSSTYLRKFINQGGHL